MGGCRSKQCDSQVWQGHDRISRAPHPWATWIKRLAFFMLITAAVGIRLAVWIISSLFQSGGSDHGAAKGATADLYISVVFVAILTIVGLSMLKDVSERKTGNRAFDKNR